MDTKYDQNSTVDTPSSLAYPHEKIDAAPSREGQNDIEPGKKGIYIGTNDLGVQSNNSSTGVYLLSEEEGSKRRSFNLYWKIGHAFIWAVMTGYVSLSTSLQLKSVLY